MLETPIAFFIWQRPSLTAKVFARIREMQPKTLIIVADGPKDGNLESNIRCRRTRAVVETVDWPCEVIRDYAPRNMGLQDRIESGLDFVFDHVERAIILEDDCLPDPSFFPFVEEMLNRYADDERVGCVGGDKPPQVRVEGTASYGFTRYTMIWGWATWRRVWRRHDRRMGLWPAARETGFLECVFGSQDAVRFWSTWFDRQYHRDMRTWDIGLTFSCWINGMRSIVPATNLVANIGFGADATHTLGTNDPRANQRTCPMAFPLRHPPTVRLSPDIDAMIEKTVFSRDSHAFGPIYHGLHFERVRHAFGRYLYGRTDLDAPEKLAVLQEALLCGAPDLHLLSDDSCQAFLDRLRGCAPSVLRDEPPPPTPERTVGGGAAKGLDADGLGTVICRAGFSPPEGPFPEYGIGRLRWMIKPSGIIEIPGVRGGDYLLLITLGNLAPDQRADIAVDGNHVDGFDIVSSAWDPLYRVIAPVTLLPGDATVVLSATSHVSESAERDLYLAVFGLTLIRRDGELEYKQLELRHGDRVVDLVSSRLANRVADWDVEPSGAAL